MRGAIPDMRQFPPTNVKLTLHCHLISIKARGFGAGRIEAMASLAPPLFGGTSDGSLPRYTCYPTPTRFGAQVGAAQFDGWASALPSGARVALHLHVPFCSRLCWFCACRTQGVTGPEPVTAYVEALSAEIDRVAGILPAGVEIVSMHWGGGSPTILTPELIRTLHARIRARLPLAAGCEFSVEIEPDTTGTDVMAELAECGLGRASIGLQAFDPRVQRAIGRAQSPDHLGATFGLLRGLGVGNFTVDVLYGLPFQDEQSVAETCEHVLAQAPARVSLSGYAHVPWMAKRQRMIPESTLPGPVERREQFRVAAERLRRAGYVACGVDHFARDGDVLGTAASEGRLRRDLLGYTPEPVDAVIGLGAAAISRFPQGFVQNAVETGAYSAAVAAGRGAGGRGVALGLEDRVRWRAIEMLLCDLRLDLGRLRVEFGDFVRVIDAVCASAVEIFGGLVERSAEGLTLRGDDPLLARRLARLFDAHAGNGFAPQG
jgi:oxygen-independent coproporphyrinogen III oxidase